MFEVDLAILSGMLSVIILAVIQALTEFIPVSSSGHLLAAERLTSLESSVALDVALHFGTLIAIVVYFFGKIAAICMDPKKNARLIKNLILTSIPAALAGFFLEDFITGDARQLLTVIIMLSVVGVVMIFSDKILPKQTRKSIDSVTPKDSILIGLAQAFALIPGTSRSGITILAARSQGLTNGVAAEYSFLAGVPVIAGAALKVAIEPETRDVLSSNMGEVILGVVVAFVVGLSVLKFLITYISKHGLAIFGWYRLALAGILFILYLNQ